MLGEPAVEMSFIGNTSALTYTVNGLITGEEYFFVVTAVCQNGNESYHSLTPEDASFDPEPVTAP